jgi:hypothetical protein
LLLLLLRLLLKILLALVLTAVLLWYSPFLSPMLFLSFALRSIRVLDRGYGYRKPNSVSSLSVADCIQLLLLGHLLGMTLLNLTTQGCCPEGTSRADQLKVMALSAFRHAARWYYFGWAYTRIVRSTWVCEALEQTFDYLAHFWWLCVMWFKALLIQERRHQR